MSGRGMLETSVIFVLTIEILSCKEILKYLSAFIINAIKISAKREEGNNRSKLTIPGNSHSRFIALNSNSFLLELIRTSHRSQSNTRTVSHQFKSPYLHVQSRGAHVHC